MGPDEVTEQVVSGSEDHVALKMYVFQQMNTTAFYSYQAYRR